MRLAPACWSPSDPLGRHRHRRRAHDGPVPDDDVRPPEFQADRPELRLVVFDVPILAGVDLRQLRRRSVASSWSCSPRRSTCGWSWRRSSTRLEASRRTWRTAGSKALSWRIAGRRTPTVRGPGGARSRTRRGSSARVGGLTVRDPMDGLDQAPRRCSFTTRRPMLGKEACRRDGCARRRPSNRVGREPDRLPTFPTSVTR